MATATREQFRQALAELASKARASLPDANGRIDAAVKLVLAGDVELLPDGTAQVASSTDPLTRYLVNGTCPCRDFAQAPSHLCRHRLAAIFARRAHATLPALTTIDVATPVETSYDQVAATARVEASAQFIAVCRRSKWSKHVTNSPFLALLAMAGSNAACKISSACSNAFR